MDNKSVVGIIGGVSLATVVVGSLLHQKNKNKLPLVIDSWSIIKDESGVSFVKFVDSDGQVVSIELAKDFKVSPSDLPSEVSFNSENSKPIVKINKNTLPKFLEDLIRNIDLTSFEKLIQETKSSNILDGATGDLSIFNKFLTKSPQHNNFSDKFSMPSKDTITQILDIAFKVEKAISIVRKLKK